MENEYKTLDLGEAAALHAGGFVLLRLEKTRKINQRAFIFTTKSATDNRLKLNAKEVVEEYRNHHMMINAYGYYLAIKEVKSRLHDDLEENN